MAGQLMLINVQSFIGLLYINVAKAHWIRLVGLCYHCRYWKLIAKANAATTVYNLIINGSMDLNSYAVYASIICLTLVMIWLEMNVLYARVQQQNNVRILTKIAKQYKKNGRTYSSYLMYATEQPNTLIASSTIFTGWFWKFHKIKWN